MVDKFDKVFSILAKANPDPKTELNFTNDFTLLMAIILSAQSTDVGVNKATYELFKLVSRPEDLKNLGIDGLKPYIKSLGLYNSKAKNLIALADILVNQDIPKNIEGLEKLPGVGSKTARVFLNCAYAVPVIAVDTHVFRVSKRIGLAKKNDVKGVEKELNELVPSEWKLNAHHWLILHGRYVCKARKPDCDNCSINKYCDYYISYSDPICQTKKNESIRFS